jgi:hypothetical protein
MSLLATLHVGQTYELCHVNVILILACFRRTIVWQPDGSSAKQRSLCMTYMQTVILDATLVSCGNLSIHKSELAAVIGWQKL